MGKEYGARLNAEAVFFQLAQQSFEDASAAVWNVEDLDKDGNPTTFKGYEMDEAVAAATVAIVGWATCAEGMLNKAWNGTIKVKLSNDKMSNYLLEKISIPDKIGYLSQHLGIDSVTLPWMSDLADLFRLRNKMVHYKEEMQWHAHGAAPQIQRDLSQANLRRYQAAVQGLGRDLIAPSGVHHLDFLDGEYFIWEIDHSTAR